MGLENTKQNKDWSKNIPRIELPKGTPMFCITTRTIVFFEQSGKRQGITQSMGAGAMENYELRKPTEDDIRNYAKDRIYAEEEIQSLITEAESWNSVSYDQEELPRQM